MKYIHILLFVCVTALTASAEPIADLWKKYGQVNNPSQQVTLLLEIGKQYQTYKNQAAVDSVLEIAIDIAQMSGNDSIAITAYTAYFKYANGENEEKALEYSKSFLNIANHSGNTTWLYNANEAAAEVLISLNKTDEALEKINKAYYYAGLSNNDTFKIDCFLIWGECLEKTNNKLDAFRNYLNALYLAQKNKNKELIYESYNKLSFFYFLIGNYERSRDYTIKQFGILSEKGKAVDSLKMMNLLCDLSLRYFYNKERTNGEKTTEVIIQYAQKHNNSYLLRTAIDYHRKYLIENGLYTDLAEMYTQKFPSELKNLAKDDSITYFRIMAYISEARGYIDSAKLFYEKVESTYKKQEGKPIPFSNFYKRYGQFLLRTGNASLAKTKMEDAYKYAKDADYLPYLVETTAYLDSLNYKEGNLKQAYEYAKLNKQYADEQQAVTKQDAMLIMEIDNETKQRELIAEQEQEETEHRHNVQYVGIVIGIISCFIILIMLGIFKVSKVVIRSLGFFAFIFFFEFIILLLDHKIMEITHHEPWKMLGIKIVIIGFMLPFHHWIEHRVTHYLIEHKIVTPQWLDGKKFWKKKQPKKETELPDGSEL